jgi:hypothetical protein
MAGSASFFLMRATRLAIPGDVRLVVNIHTGSASEAVSLAL